MGGGGGFTVRFPYVSFMPIYIDRLDHVPSAKARTTSTDSSTRTRAPTTNRDWAPVVVC